MQAIRTVPCGSAGGPDGLRPQHLKYMIGPSSGAGVEALLSALLSFVSLVLNGECHESIRPLFFGANLTALRKKNGGIRPIALGGTLRRLVAKMAGGKVMERISLLLSP